MVFLPKSLAKQVQERFDVTVTLEPSHGGIYAISIGDEVIYNNLEQGGMLPDVQEILATLEGKIKPSVFSKKNSKTQSL